MPKFGDRGRLQIVVFPSAEQREAVINSFLGKGLPKRRYQLHFVRQPFDHKLRPDVILLDTGSLRHITRDLPQALKQLRQSAWSDAPVILLDDPDAEILYGFADGYEARISLNAPPDVILQVLESVLASHAPSQV